MTCEDLAPISELSCLLRNIQDSLAAPDGVGITGIIVGAVGIVVSGTLAFVALRLSRSTNTLAASSNALAESTNALAESANELAAQAIELNRRAERRRYGEAVLGYFNERWDDLMRGENYGARHDIHSVLGVASEVNEPNSDVLITWLTDTIDVVLDPATYPVNGDERKWHFLRMADAHRLKKTVPIEVGRWVHDPEGFVPDRFIVEKGMELISRDVPGSTT